MAFVVSGNVDRKDGMLCMDWAMESPVMSISEAAKSFDSRVGKENAVRRSVAPASFMSERRRAHKTWLISA